MEEARRVDETIRTQMGPLMAHDVRDIRVHDSQQASELAGRLGRESASSEGHTYASLDTGTAGSKEDAGLSVRERMHVIRRTSARPLPLAPPLRRYQTPPSGGTATSTQMSQGVTVQRAGARYQPGDSVQRRGEEAMAQRAAEADMPRESPSASRTELEVMADMVYHMMMRELVLERERRRCR